MRSINIVSATKYSEQEFWEKSALGLSLARLSFESRIKPKITFENSVGLGIVYNNQIMLASNNDIMVFIHDDVWIDDGYLVNRIDEGLQQFDIIGVAGNVRRLPFQPTWITTDISFNFDDAVNLSGRISLGQNPAGPIRCFGSVPASCEMLDGVFMAAPRHKLVENSVFFDPQFDFHFYDLDFCRTARSRSLILGTWPISLTHQGQGLFGTDEWNKMWHAYLNKWKT